MNGYDMLSGMRMLKVGLDYESTGDCIHVSLLMFACECGLCGVCRFCSVRRIIARTLARVLTRDSS